MNSFTETWSNTVARASPGIVSIRVSATRAFEGSGASHSFATGFIVDARRGLILTNRHVVTTGPVRCDAVFSNSNEQVPLQRVYADPLHDFGFFLFDPKSIKHMELVEIQIRPEKVRVGMDVRVVGNDAGEKLSILSGMLSRLDRAVPDYGNEAATYNDGNTFYLAAASGTSGGSSGSPVLSIEGYAVAMNAGGRRSSASSFYIPLDRAVRALRLIQYGLPVPRGDLQVTWSHEAFDDARRLGLSRNSELMIREVFPRETGALLVQQVLPEGPADPNAYFMYRKHTRDLADYGLEPGDALTTVNGIPTSHFVPLEEALDNTRAISMAYSRVATALGLQRSVEMILSASGEQLVRRPSSESLHELLRNVSPHRRHTHKLSEDGSEESEEDEESTGFPSIPDPLPTVTICDENDVEVEVPIQAIQSSGQLPDPQSGWHIEPSYSQNQNLNLSMASLDPVRRPTITNSPTMVVNANQPFVPSAPHPNSPLSFSRRHRGHGAILIPERFASLKSIGATTPKSHLSHQVNITDSANPQSPICGPQAGRLSAAALRGERSSIFTSPGFNKKYGMVDSSRIPQLTPLTNMRFSERGNVAASNSPLLDALDSTDGDSTVSSLNTSKDLASGVVLNDAEVTENEDHEGSHAHNSGRSSSFPSVSFLPFEVEDSIGDLGARFAKSSLKSIQELGTLFCPRDLLTSCHNERIKLFSNGGQGLTDDGAPSPLELHGCRSMEEIKDYLERISVELPPHTPYNPLCVNRAWRPFHREIEPWMLPLVCVAEHSALYFAANHALGAGDVPDGVLVPVAIPGEPCHSHTSTRPIYCLPSLQQAIMRVHRCLEEFVSAFESIVNNSGSEVALPPLVGIQSLQGMESTRKNLVEALASLQQACTVELRVDRGGIPRKTEISVLDLHAVVPSEFLEISSAIIHPLSLMAARNSSLPIGGCYVTLTGYMLSRAEMPVHAVIIAVGKTKTPDIATLATAFAALPSRAKVPIRYFTLSDTHRERIAIAEMDRTWFEMIHWTRNDATGCWDPVSFPNHLIPRALSDGTSGNSQGLEVGEWLQKPQTARYTPVAGASQVAQSLWQSLVILEVAAPILPDGVQSSSFIGCGVVVDSKKGLIVTDRNTVVVASVDICITFASSVEVPGRVLFLHPHHNFAVVQYDPHLLGETDVRSAELACQSTISVGQAVLFVGITPNSSAIVQQAVVTKVDRVAIQDAHPPRFRAYNSDGLYFDRVAPCLGGVFADEKTGRVGALWASFAYTTSDGSPGEFSLGMPVDLIHDALLALRAGAVPQIRSLKTEFGVVPLSKARAAMGLSEDWVRLLEDAGGDRRQVLSVRRCSPVSAAASVLREGDLILAVDGEPVVTARQVEVFIAYADQFRSVEQNSFKVQSGSKSGHEISKRMNSFPMNGINSLSRYEKMGSNSFGDENCTSSDLASSVSEKHFNAIATGIQKAQDAAEPYANNEQAPDAVRQNSSSSGDRGGNGNSISEQAETKVVPQNAMEDVGVSTENQRVPVRTGNYTSASSSNAGVGGSSAAGYGRPQRKSEGGSRGERVDGDSSSSDRNPPADIPLQLDFESAVNASGGQTLGFRRLRRASLASIISPSQSTFQLTLLRDGEEVRVELRPDVITGRGTDTVLIWGGLLLQAAHDPVIERGFVPPEGGVYISRWSFGSPAHKGGLRATNFITHVNDTPTPTIKELLNVVREFGDQVDVRIRCTDLTGRKRVFSLTTDNLYWPTYLYSLTGTSIFDSKWVLTRMTK